MFKIKNLIIALTCLLLSGCAQGNYQYQGGQMISGKLISLSDGTLLPMQIELSTGQGQITATHPTTGETFNGSYTAIAETKHTQYSQETLFGPETTRQAVEVSSVVPASAVLVGNKGTVISLNIKIKPGNEYVKPIGYGDGTDNKNGKYNVQF